MLLDARIRTTLRRRSGAGTWARALLTASLIACGTAAAAPSPDRAAAAEPLRRGVEQLLFGGALEVGNATIVDRIVLGELYARSGLECLWSDAAAAAWIAWLPRIERDGLRPDDYYLRELRSLAAVQKRDAQQAADLDLLLTASLARAANDLRFGKTEPARLDPSWNLPRSTRGWDAVATLEAAIASGTPGQYLERLLPRPNLYRELQTALDDYRAIAAAGGWPTVPGSGTLKRGDSGPRVTALARRLAVTGDYLRSETYSAEFDALLQDAVRGFQRRHGLDDDGAVGPATLAALNVPVEARVDQIRLNLERGRWVFDNLPDRFLVINIASFQAFLVEHDTPVWSARTQVGRYYRQTPTFRGDIQYLVLNPTWTIPPTILREDVVPRAKRDPRYLQQNEIDVRTADGRLLDPRALDWTKLTPRNFPYVLEQRAGPNNPLGHVKFVFPNEHFVFLHDTPSRAQFGQATRTFSSGCIRVEDAVTLATLTLADPEHYSRELLEAAIGTGATRTVRLEKALPILILYWTASVDAAGTLRFLPDVYNRDARVLAALDAPPP